MIPVVLVTGFLGSGKTTFLRHLIETYPGRRLVFVVNEFSRLDVDSRLVADLTDDFVAVPGGSIFCTCLVSEFVEMLTALPERFHSAETPIEGVIIEASGIANPKVIERMLRETRLDELYTLARVISIVDPGVFPTLMQTLPNIIAQIEASDAVLLNKTDLYDEEVLTKVEQELLAIQPGAQIVRTRHCVADVDLFAGREQRGLDGEYGKCVDPNFARLTVVVPQDCTVERLRQALEGVREDVYRAKGFVHVESAIHYVDFSPAALTFSPTDQAEDVGKLVVITRGTAYEHVRKHLAESLRAN